jgi:ABC-type proline/glycine betaine transport system ATPase subunit
MIAETQFTVEDFRKRIQLMTDEKLVQTGKAARYMADPRNSADKRTVRDVYVIQLQECRAEWKRRHPKAE